MSSDGLGNDWNIIISCIEAPDLDRWPGPVISYGHIDYGNSYNLEVQYKYREADQETEHAASTLATAINPESMFDSNKLVNRKTFLPPML
jgi:hypothetical protein